jgi:hypothetical protein
VQRIVFFLLTVSRTATCSLYFRLLLPSRSFYPRPFRLLLALRGHVLEMQVGPNLFDLFCDFLIVLIDFFMDYLMLPIEGLHFPFVMEFINATVIFEVFVNFLGITIADLLDLSQMPQIHLVTHLGKDYVG